MYHIHTNVFHNIPMAFCIRRTDMHGIDIGSEPVIQSSRAALESRLCNIVSPSFAKVY